MAPLLPIVLTALILSSSNSVENGQNRDKEIVTIVYYGETTINQGRCKQPGDVNVRTPHYSFSIAAETAVPWNAPKGAILDAIAATGDPGAVDRLAYFDFLPDGWRLRDVYKTEIVVTENTGSNARILIKREMADIATSTTYEISVDSRILDVSTNLTNTSASTTLSLEPGYSLVARSSGRAFVTPSAPNEPGPGKWAAIYGSDWMIAGYFPNSGFTQTASTSADMLTRVSVSPGQTVSFKARLLFKPDSDLSSAMKALSTTQDLVSVTGSFPLNMEDRTAVVAYCGTRVCSWTIAQSGNFELLLKPGKHEIQAISQNLHTTQVQTVLVSAESQTQPITLSTLAKPTEVRVLPIDTTGRPIHARAVRPGSCSDGPFSFPSVAYSPADPAQPLVMSVPSNSEDIQLSHAAPFLSKPVKLMQRKQGDTTAAVTVQIPQLIDHHSLGLRCADLHHHSDQVDGRNPIDLLVSGQMAAGLDFLTVTDHDTIINHGKLVSLGSLLQVPIIASVEISTPWGHFNPFVWDLHHDYNINTKTISPNDLFAFLHSHDYFVQVNHGFGSSSPYFLSARRNELPGPYSNDFDLVELNGHDGLDPSDWEVLQQARSSWSTPDPKFLSGGSDCHDLLSGHDDDVSGSIRTCVFTNDTDSDRPQTFVAAAATGRSFVTTGPMLVIDPPPGFGHLEKPPTIKAWSTSQLDRIELHGPSGLLHTQQCSEAGDLSGPAFTCSMSFPQIAPTPDWVHFVVIDADGHAAISNPHVFH